MTDDQRRIASTVLTTMADTLPVWRDGAIAVLALIVIGCILFLAAIVPSGR